MFETLNHGFELAAGFVMAAAQVLAFLHKGFFLFSQISIFRG